MSDLLMRPIVTNEDMKKLVGVPDRWATIDWVEICLGENENFFGSSLLPATTIYDILNECCENEYKDEKDNSVYVSGKIIIERKGVPLLMLRRPKKRDRNGVEFVYAEAKIIPTPENVNLFTAMANEGFGMKIDVYNGVCDFLYDHLGIFPKEQLESMELTRLNLVKREEATSWRET
jgi:hypothetical protein